MIKTYYTLTFLLCIINGYAQNIIKGNVTGNQNNLGLPYSQVHFKNASTGTITNEYGEFELHFNKSEMNDTLIISSIGYEPFSEPISKIVSEKYTIFSLKEKPFTLNEVSVTPTLPIGQIIKKVQEGFKTNYSQNTFYLEGFFRRYVKYYGGYDALIEAALVLKNKGFNLNKKEWKYTDAYIKEVRSSYNLSPLTDTIDKTNNVDGLLISCEKKMFEAFNNNLSILYIDGIQYDGNDKIIFLKYNKINDLGDSVGSTFKINSTTWGIEEFEGNINYKIQIKKLAVDSLKRKDYSFKINCKYRYFNGLYFLNYAHEKLTRDIISPTKTVYYEFSTEYATNNIYFENVELSKSNLINRGRNLFLQVRERPYHQNFWSNYNLIVDNPELEQIRKDLQKSANIDNQFNSVDKHPTNK
jgi:hypothetical protein